MPDIGSKIVELRRHKSRAQSDWAEAIGASRDIIGKYERNENSPSVEMAFKFAKVFDGKVDYLPGEGKHASYDNETVKRQKKIGAWDKDTRIGLFDVIDTYLRDFRTRNAYVK